MTKKLQGKWTQAEREANFLAFMGLTRPHRPAPRQSKQKVTLGLFVKKTAGGRHAWYNSNVGLVRKPI